MPAKYTVAAVTVAALFIDLLDLTIVNIAIPDLQQEFAAPAATAQWAITAYVLVVAVTMPASGWAADRFGPTSVFLFALGSFTAGSALCAAAPTIETLIAARAAQGIGGGMLVPVAMAILFRSFPEDERTTASAIFSVPAALAPALGPLIGGQLAATLGWRWVFAVNIPIGLLALAAAAVCLDRTGGRDRAARLDVPGWMTGAAGLVLLTLALARAGIGPGPMLRPDVLLPLGAGLVALAIFIRIELTTGAPMVDLSLFTRRTFAFGNAIMFFASAGFGALLFALPLFLHDARHLDLPTAGALLACHALGIIITTVAGLKLLRWIGTRLALAAGLTVSAAASAAFALLPATTPLGVLAAVLIAAGAGFGLLIVPLQTVPFDHIPDSSLARGTAILGVIRQLGVALGTAAAAIPLGHGGTAHGFPAAFDLAAVLTLLGIPVALTLTAPTRETAN